MAEAPAPLHRQKTAVLRAHEILTEIYPARIAQQKATEAGAKAHLALLDEALKTLDKLDTATNGTS